MMVKTLNSFLISFKILRYNLSLLWLYSILLIYCIDMLEFIVVGDAYVHSKFSIIVVCLSLCLIVSLCLRYIDLNKRNDPQFYRNMIGLCFTLCFFAIIVFTRVWLSRWYRPKNARDSDRGVRDSTYYFLYQIVLLMFSTVQLYENVKANFARVLTNSAYVIWISAAMLQSFYLSILPQSPR